MSEIEILNDMPVIFTKDGAWVDNYHPRIEPGAIIILPEDAVLSVPRYEVNQAVDVPLSVELPSERKASKKASPPPHPSNH